MFTGIVLGMGRLVEREERDGNAHLKIEATVLSPAALVPGASVAVNGCCLTVAQAWEQGLHADASSETLARTTLGKLSIGVQLNLEPALAFGEALGGHLVSGHVDGVGVVIARREDGSARRLRFRAPDVLARFIAAKGSITVDGVSLTVNEVAGAEFEVALIPATLERTISDDYATGTRVNLEVDLIARYLDRLLATRSDSPSSRGT
ncbi:MAG: riboflavin synthase [Gammaproteobacteria bacterium]